MKKATPSVTKRYRILRSCLCFALVLTLALGHIVPISVAKAAETEDTGGETTGWASEENLLDLDFSETETELIGEITAVGGTNITLSDFSGAGFSVGTDPSDPTNKCFKMQQSSVGHDLIIDWYIVQDGTPKKLVYEFEISGVASVIADETTEEYMSVFTSGTTRTVYVKRNKGTTAGVINGSGTTVEGSTIEAGKWTKFAVVADYDTKTYDLYVDGVKAVTGAAFNNNGLRFRSRGTSNGPGALLVDNLKVYEGTAPRVEAPKYDPDLLNLDFSETEEELKEEIIAVGGTNITLSDFSGAGFSVGTDPSDPTNKCFKMQQSSVGHDLIIDWYVVQEGTPKKLVYEFKISGVASVIADETTEEYMSVFTSGTTRTVYVKRGKGTTAGVINGSGTNAEATIEAGKWTKFVILADYETKTYDLYVDGTKVVTGGTFNNNGLRFRSRGSYGPGALLVDDLRVYEGTEPHDPPKAEEGGSGNEGTGGETPSEPPVVGDEIFTCLTFEEESRILEEVIGYTGDTTNIKLITESNGNRYLQMETTGPRVNINYKASSDSNPAPQYIVAEFDASTLEQTNGKTRLFYAQQGSVATHCMLYAYNNSVQPNSSTDLDVDLAPGKWTNVALAIDLYNHKYTVYVDGQAKGTYNVTASMTQIVTMSTRLENDGGAGSLLIDNLKVYEGTEPREIEYDGSVGKNVYVNRTFDEVYMYDLEELEIVRNASVPVVVKGTDGNKYLKLEVKDANAASSVAYITSAESNWIVAQAKVCSGTGADNDGILFAGSDAEKNAVTFLKIVDNSVQLADGTEVAVLSADAFKDIAVALNVREKKYDVYVDGVKVKEAVGYTAPANFAQITTTMENGTLLIDDLKVYDAKTPKTTWVVDNNPDTIYLPNSFAENLLGNAVAIQLNANILYTPATKKIEAKEKFDLSDEGKVYLAQADIEKLFGADTVIGNAAVKDGMYDVLAVAKNSGYTYVHEMENRMFIFSKSEITLLNSGDKADAKSSNEYEVNLYLQFERPTADRIKDLFEIAGAKNEHPRILITQQDVDNLRRLYNSGHELVKKWGDETIAAAEVALLSKDFTYVVTGSSMADVDATRPMMLNLCMAWLLTGEQKYADKAYHMAEIICNLPDWNPVGYLDIGEFCVLVGVVYDWLYDILSDEQKLFLEKAILEKGVSIQQKIYYEGKAPEGVYWTWWDNTNNFNAVCNGGTMVGAVVLFDKYPDVCAQVISNTMRGLERMMISYYPEGAWFEGVNYWRYTLGYLSYTIMTFENAFGDDFGLLSSPGLEKTGWFGLSLTGSTGSYNFGDSGSTFIDNTHALWCATQFGDAELMAARLLEMEKLGQTGTAHELLYFSEALYNECGEVGLSLDTEISSSAIVSMKEKWFDTNATWLAANGMIPKSNHGHLDTGSFVVDMLGERLIIDIGANNYDASGYFSTQRYHYYRTRPEGHNMFLINPVAQLDDYGGFAPWVDASGSGITATAEGAYYTIDLSDVYAEDTTSAIRGYMLMDDRRNVVIRDEITFKEGTTNTFYSFFHTKADVEIVDQNTAVLTQNGKKYKVTMATNAENYTFSVVAAEPLFDIHKLAGNSSNEGISKLQFFTDSASGNLTFTLRITAYDDPAADKTAADLHNVALAQWDTLLTQDGEITVLPKLDMIYVNGEELANFNPDTTGYTGQLASAAMLPIVTASSENYERIEVIPATDFGKDYVIKVYDNKDENTYRVYRLNYTRIPELEPIDGRVRYPIAGGTQSDVNEIAPNGDYLCTIDNDFTINSRWGAQGTADTEHWLMLELDEVSTVHKIGIGFCYGNKRYMHFKLEVSVDGENWTTVYNGLDTTKQTNELNTELQYFYDNEEGIPAKYVRYSGPGGRKPTDTTVTNYWHHISEFVVLGPKEVTEYYEQGANEALEMIYSGELTSVTLGEETIAAENYTVTAGNASVVSLKPEYLDTLTAGSYQLTMNYADGTSAVVTLEILPVGASAVQIIPEGTVGSYEQKSGESVAIHASGIPEELVGVMVNGELIGTSNYVVTAGSTIVTFKNEYLDALAPGEYKVELLYSGNRSVETTLTISEEETTTAPESEETTTESEETTTEAEETTTESEETTTEAEETTTESEETTTEAEETTTESEETTTEAEETTTEAEETTTEAEETTTEAEETTTETEESTEVNASTEAGTNAAPGGDPDTGDLNSATRWLWLVVVAAVVMTGYALMIERKKQR